ncbi:MAG: hypothetical protein LBK73_15835 [Treponema sp.]|jgi:hypothetical protein|nr:hypothetical protein [Treponema sp.]
MQERKRGSGMYKPVAIRVAIAGTSDRFIADNTPRRRLHVPSKMVFMPFPVMGIMSDVCHAHGNAYPFMESGSGRTIHKGAQRIVRISSFYNINRKKTAS